MKYYSLIYLMHKVNMKSKFTLFSFLMHIPGLIMYIIKKTEKKITLCLNNTLPWNDFASLLATLVGNADFLKSCQ